MLLLTLFYGCNKACILNEEIKDKKFVNEEVIKAVPDFDLYKLRIDILRQTETVTETTTVGVNTTVDQTVDQEYSDLGFDLGSGLFFDLNQNLSLRVDKLFNINSNESFEVKYIYYSKKQKFTTHKYTNNEYKTISKKGNENHIFNIKTILDTTFIYYKNKFKYHIIKNDSALWTGKKSKIWDNILMENDTTFYTDKKKKYEVKMTRKFIFYNYYQIQKDTSNSFVSIQYISNRKKNKTTELFKMYRSGNTIIIIDKNGCEKRIEYDNKVISIKNSKGEIETKYERV